MPSLTAVAPAWSSLLDFHDTSGPEVGDVAKLAGFDPDPEQQMVLDQLFAFDRHGDSVAFETAVVAPRQNLKALAWDTPILTGRGFVPIAEVVPGDTVFHPGGHRVTVTHGSDVKVGSTCYRVVLTDGRSVVADAGHLWTVRDKRRSRWVTVTTQEMLDAGLSRAASGETRRVTTGGKSYATREYRWGLPRQEPLKSDDIDLPVDPYLLGAWLGDGTTRGGRFASHADDVDHWCEQMTRAGFTPVVRVERTCTMVSATYPGPGRSRHALTANLRRLGLLGDKHVPDVYLLAGTSQREALLQGLMDTDGTISRSQGQAIFTSTKEELADAVAYLARSLGWRVGRSAGRAMLDGKDCGPRFTVQFTPKTCDGFSPFRLARKRSLIRSADGGRGRFSVSVKSIDRIGSVPVRCIKVDSPDGLFLAGRELIPTHNTAVCKMAALGWLFITEQRLVVWSAHEFRTAQEAFRDMTELVESSPDLDREVKAIYRGNGDEAIELLNGCRLIFKARTKGGGRGLTGDKVVLDEAFALRPVHMGALLPTLAARPDPQVLYGSSAGMVDSDVLRGIRDRGRKGDDRRLAYFEWGDLDPGTCDIDGCDHALGTPGCALDDRSRWERANPAYGRRITEESLTAFRQALPPEEFAREFLGWWDEPATNDSDLTAADWVAVETEAGPSGALFMAVDVAPSHTWASIAACGNGVIELVERRRGTGWLTERMTELVEKHGVSAFGVDPAGPVGVLLPEFERAGLPVSMLDGKDAVRACGALVAGVSEGTVSHRGEPELLAAVGGASRRAVGDGWKWSRKDSTVDISPLVAATYSHWLWLSHNETNILDSVW